MLHWCCVKQQGGGNIQRVATSKESCLAHIKKKSDCFTYDVAGNVFWKRLLFCSAPLPFKAVFWQHMWHFVCFKRLTLLLTVPFALQRCDFLVLVTIVCLKRLIRMSILFQRLTYVCGHCLKRLSLCLFYCIYVYTLYIYGLPYEAQPKVASQCATWGTHVHC